MCTDRPNGEEVSGFPAKKNRHWNENQRRAKLLEIRDLTVPVPHFRGKGSNVVLIEEMA